MKKIKILDTTLRDGEQTSNVSFTTNEKMILAENFVSVLNFDRVEIGSCKVSEQEFESVSKISQWAIDFGHIDKIEVLSFCDFDKSINWLLPTGCKNINLLTKGSRRHCEIQLKKTQKQHCDDIEKTIEYAEKNGIKYSVYLEDWSRGIVEDEDYVMKMCEFLTKFNTKSVILCDTMGVLNPWSVEKLVFQTVSKFPNLSFDFHCHNDYGLAVANSMSAIKAGSSCIHTSINGLGERAGNANSIEFCVAAKDHLGIDFNINEAEFSNTSSIVERFSGKKVSHNAPIVGRDVFTQTAGIHADGDKKGGLYKSSLSPDRFSRNIEYSLGKMSGRGNLEMNLQRTGIILTDDQKKIVLEKIVKMADEKKTISFDDLPFIISDAFGVSGSIKQDFSVLDCVITSSTNLSPIANIKISYKEQEFFEFAQGNGGYDAFMNALQKISKKCDLFIPKLIDFEVTIPRGGETNALVETIIIWQDGVRTSGVSSDQIMSSIRATEKAINVFCNRKI